MFCPRLTQLASECDKIRKSAFCELRLTVWLFCCSQGWVRFLHQHVDRKEATRNLLSHGWVMNMLPKQGPQYFHWPGALRDSRKAVEHWVSQRHDRTSELNSKSMWWTGLQMRQARALRAALKLTWSPKRSIAPLLKLGIKRSVQTKKPPQSLERLLPKRSPSPGLVCTIYGADAGILQVFMQMWCG